MQWPLALAILATALFSIELRSQEIPIGHLETKDDPDAISSWVFFNCNRNGQVMICDMFQTLISYELRPEQRASEIEKQMQGNPVKEFRDSFGTDCQSVTAMVQSLKTGRGQTVGLSIPKSFPKWLSFHGPFSTPSPMPARTPT